MNLSSAKICRRKDLIGESWEIVDRPEAQSIVRNGPLRGKTLHELWTQYRDEIFGDVPDSPRFPLLLKLLDAHEKLSLQVHPPAKFAERLGGEPKTEFWYVVAADPGAEIYLGFRESITREQFEKALRDGTAADHVYKIRVKTGDAAFLPSGRLHALGAGNLLIEIQQNSDTTYRVFDWNRVDDKGKQRQLHIDQALQCIDFSDVRPRLVQPEGELLLRHNLFEIRKWASRFTAGDRPSRAVRNRLLPHWLCALRWRRSWAWGIFPHSGSAARPATEANQQWDKPIANHDSKIVGRPSRTQIHSGLRATACKIKPESKYAARSRDF